MNNNNSNTQNNIYFQKCDIFNSLFENIHLNEIVNVAEKYLENPIFILDTSYHIISRSNLAEKDNPSIEVHKGEYYLLPELILCLKEEKFMYTIYNSNKAFFYSSHDDFIFSPIKINDLTIFYICILEENRKFYNTDLDLTNTLSKVLSIKLEKEDIFKSNSGYNDEYYLKELLDTNINDIDYIIKRLKNTNFTLKKYFLFISIPLSQKFNDYRHNFTLNFLVQNIKSIIGNCLFTYHKNMLVFLLSDDNENVLTNSVKDRLSEFLKLNSLECSISFSFNDLIYIKDFFYQCIYALELYEILNHKKTFILFEDYMEYYLFHASSNNNKYKLNIKTLIHPYIKKIQDYDESNNNELLKTLNEYFLNNHNANLTSSKLNIHRSTFFYRFHKIESILNTSLTNNSTLSRLAISLSILNYINLKY